MKNTLIIIGLATLLYACAGRIYTYTEHTPQTYNDAVSPRKFTAGNDFELFVRNTHKHTENGVTRVSHMYPDTSRNIIDQNFLLISWKSKIAAYFTYRPDKYLKMLTKLNLQDTAINFFYLRSIQFGRISEDTSTITFTERSPEKNGKKDEWKISVIGSTLAVHAINEFSSLGYQNTINTDMSFGLPVKFTKVKDYELVYQEPLNKTDIPLLSSAVQSLSFFDQGKRASLKKWTSYHVLKDHELHLSKDGKNILMHFQASDDEDEIYLSYRKSRLLYFFDSYFSTSSTK